MNRYGSTTCRLALVLWSGRVGGSETLMVALAESLRRLGACVTVVIIEKDVLPLERRLADVDLPYRSLGLTRGRQILGQPRRYAAEVSNVGPDGAILAERGFMATALRIGGYQGTIVGVEHGALFFDNELSRHRRGLRRISRLCGAWSSNAEVAVSDFMLFAMRRHAHSRRTSRIYNGVDPQTYRPRTDAQVNRGCDVTVGCATRLIPGKGVEVVIEAIAEARRMSFPIRLMVAGDGPERDRLVALSDALGVDSQVELLGIVDDMPAFWQKCDLAVIAPTFVESFSMTTLEAMASGVPIVATRIGAIPELITDSETGTLVDPGNVHTLARAMITYAEQPDLRDAHGAAARSRAVERFHIDDCARAYLALFAE